MSCASISVAVSGGRIDARAGPSKITVGGVPAGQIVVDSDNEDIEFTTCCGNQLEVSTTLTPVLVQAVPDFQIKFNQSLQVVLAQQAIKVVAQCAPAGASAYQTAVANGFVGTIAEWLASLQGADGEPGPPGVGQQEVFAQDVDPVVDYVALNFPRGAFPAHPDVRTLKVFIP